MNKRSIFNGLYWLLGGVLLFAGLYSLFFRFQIVENTNMDFRQDYLAAQNLLAGRSIYADLGDDTNYHPPSVAVWFLPLGCLSYSQSSQVWSLFTLVFLFAQVWIIWRTLNLHFAPYWLLLLVGVLLSWQPVQRHITLGQLSIPIAFLLTVAWALLRREKDIGAGIVVGLACLIKLWPALLLLYFILRRRWWALVAMISTIIGGYLITLAIAGFDDIWLYFIVMTRQDVQEYAAFPTNLSLLGVFSRLFTNGGWFMPLAHIPWLANLLTAVASLILLALLAYNTWHLPARQAGEDLAYSLNLGAMLLLSPLTGNHAFPLLLLPFGVGLSSLQQRTNQRYLYLWLGAFLMLSLPDGGPVRWLVKIFAPAPTPWHAGLLMAIGTLGMLLVYGMLTYQARNLCQERSQ